MKLPRFHIRDLFWLVLVVAMGCAWWVDRRFQSNRAAHWRAQAIQLMAWVDKNCGWIDVGLTDDNEILILRNATTAEQEELLKSRWDELP